jgi:molybdopterin converting factor subunit 1
MTYRIRLFAGARSLAGQDNLVIDLPAGSRVRDLRDALGRRCPKLQSLLERSAIAINDEYAEDDEPVADGAEIALIPPVSGG